MNRVCDHTSVGMLVWRDDKLLLVERRKPPLGFAPPAGHVDHHGSFEQAARNELKEEVGLDIEHIELIAEGRKDNSCRRQNGTWHYWKVYNVLANGHIDRNHEETKSVGWYDRDNLVWLASRTRQYLSGKILDKEWQDQPGLEPIWYEWFKQLRIML